MSANRSKHRKTPLKSLPDVDALENCEKELEDKSELLLPFKKRITDKNGKENKTDGSPCKGSGTRIRNSEAEGTGSSLDSDSDSDFDDILRSMKKKGIKTETKSGIKSVSGQKKCDSPWPNFPTPDYHHKEARKKLFIPESALNGNDGKLFHESSEKAVSISRKASSRTTPKSSKVIKRKLSQNETSQEISSPCFSSEKRKKEKSNAKKPKMGFVEETDEVDLALEEANKAFLRQLRGKWKSSKRLSLGEEKSTSPIKKIKSERSVQRETPLTPVATDCRQFFEEEDITPVKKPGSTVPVGADEEFATSLKNKEVHSPSRREAPTSTSLTFEKGKSVSPLMKRKLPTPCKAIPLCEKEVSNTPLKKRKLPRLSSNGPTNSPVYALEEEESVTPLNKRKLPTTVRCELPTTPVSKTKKNCDTPRTPLEEARVSLHVSAVPSSLPCREQEYKNILSFVESKVIDGIGGCMYISGVPGTGKTATVTQVIRHLQAAALTGDLPTFKFIEINGMRLSDPHQAYVQVYQEIFGKKDRISSSAAYKKLDTYFNKSDSKKITTVILVDELDLMCTRKQDVVYNLLDWPSKPRSRLVVLTIANTMDMPERKLKGRVNSRLGLTRLTFLPYTHKQLEEIVLARLQGTDAFVVDAVRLATRKVAAVSGDARRALDICRRAAELPVDDQPVRITHIEQAIKEMTNSNIVRLIRSCSEVERLFLRSVSDVCTRTGLEEVDLRQVMEHLLPLCVLEGLLRPPVTAVLAVCQRLRCFRLVFTNNHRSGLLQRLTLNITQDDLHYALKADI